MDYQIVNGSSLLHLKILCLIFLEPSSERSLRKSSKFSIKLRFERNGPYQYVAEGVSVSTLAHQAKPSLFPRFLINFFGPIERPVILVKFYTILE